VDTESKEASDKLTKRRPNLNFIEMGIPVGSIIQFTQSDATVVVASERKVTHNGEEKSLTYATRDLLGLPYSVAPGPYWEFNGKSLRDIYNDTYEGV